MWKARAEPAYAVLLRPDAREDAAAGASPDGDSSC